jgi:hydrogenase maturation protease
MSKKALVAGLGNPLMSDEGVGVRIIERFQLEKDKFTDVEFVDAGTAGLNLLHLIANRRKVIFIDCAYMQTPPGTIKKFSPGEVKTVKKLAGQSLHEADLLKIIEMSKQLGECPQEIVIFGIEPKEIKEKMGLSRTITDKIEYYISIINKEIQAFQPR